MRIHKEGKKIVLIITITISIVAINILVDILVGNLYVIIASGLLSITILALLLRFFRNPDRTITINEKLIISPADGKIVAIEETIEKEYFNDKRLQVSVFMSIHNVHINRYPLSGKTVYCKYHEGKYLVARHPKSSELNERFTVVIKTASGVEILVRQIAGAVARRIIAYAKQGQVVTQGQELGFIRFGSRVDIFLPPGTKINVKLGEKVKGNFSFIGEL